MVEDVNSRGSLSKSELFAKYVSTRLDQSINSYYKKLLDSKNTLSQLSNKRVVKHLTN